MPGQERQIPGATDVEMLDTCHSSVQRREKRKGKVIGDLVAGVRTVDPIHMTQVTVGITQ